MSASASDALRASVKYEVATRVLKCVWTNSYIYLVHKRQNATPQSESLRSIDGYDGGVDGAGCQPRPRCARVCGDVRDDDDDDDDDDDATRIDQRRRMSERMNGFQPTNTNTDRLTHATLTFDRRRRDKLEQHSLWLERESSVDDVVGSGERTPTTPSGSSIARSSSVSVSTRHPTSAARPTRASLAREKLVEETTRASGASRAAATPLVLSGEALRRATERLHAGAGSRSPRRSAYVDEECTFTPKIGALSRRMAAEQRRRGESARATATKKTPTLTPTPKEPVDLGTRSAEAQKQNAAETPPSMPKRVVAEKKKKENRQTKDDDEDAKECTFTPRIGRRSRALSEALLKKASMPTSFVERSKIWADRKEHILEAEREAKLEDEVRDCTFHPQQVTAAATRVAEDEPNSVATPPSVEISGLDAYLARQERARRLREEKNAILNRFDGASWTPEPTVPKEFEFHSVGASKKTCSSSKSPESLSPAPGQGVSAWRSPAYVEARAKLRLLHGSTTSRAARRAAASAAGAHPADVEGVSAQPSA